MTTQPHHIGAQGLTTWPVFGRLRALEMKVLPMTRTPAISAILLFAASGAAFAADPIRPTPAPTARAVERSSVWDGFYAGLNAGYGWGKGEAVSASAGFTSEDGDIGGWLGGAQIGYNFSSDALVFGVEADYQAADVAYTLPFPSGVSKLGIRSFGTVRGRVGADMGAFMPYVTAGLAYGKLGYEFDFAAAGVATLSDSGNSWGWAAGAGVEAMVFDNFSVKAEYLYVDLGKETLFAGTTNEFNATANAHVARIGLNYHF